MTTLEYLLEVKNTKSFDRCPFISDKDLDKLLQNELPLDACIFFAYKDNNKADGKYIVEKTIKNAVDKANKKSYITYDTAELYLSV